MHPERAGPPRNPEETATGGTGNEKLQRDRPTGLPIAGQLRSYDRAWLRGDLIAGVTVAALIVPKNLG